MTAAVAARRNKLPDTPWGLLPPRMRALFVTGAQRQGGWLADALANDNACEVDLEQAQGMVDSLAKLREEVFDTVLISHEPPELDALELLDGISAGAGGDQSTVVLGVQSEQEMAALCYEAGADAYICAHTATTRGLIWTVARSMERRRLLAENRRLRQSETHRRSQEQQEAQRLLRQQWVIADASGPAEDQPPAIRPTSAAGRSAEELPAQLVEHYRELLKTYVIMGSGNLASEIARLADMLASVGLSSDEALRLHLFVLEEMIDGLGNRSARHVMNRGDMLGLEVMMCLANDYRQRLRIALHPPRQMFLPGFDDSWRAA